MIRFRSSLFPALVAVAVAALPQVAEAQSSLNITNNSGTMWTLAQVKNSKTAGSVAMKTGKGSEVTFSAIGEVNILTKSVLNVKPAAGKFYQTFRLYPMSMGAPKAYYEFTMAPTAKGDAYEIDEADSQLGRDPGVGEIFDIDWRKCTINIKLKTLPLP